MTEPATNIMKVGDFKDAIFYHAVCDCTNSDHKHSIMVEFDAEGDVITCTICQNLEWADYQARDKIFPIRLWRRIVQSVKFIFTGYVKVSGTHLFCKEEALRDYADAILGAADELKRRRLELLSMWESARERGRRITSPNSKIEEGKGSSQSSQDLS